MYSRTSTINGKKVTRQFHDITEADDWKREKDANHASSLISPNEINPDGTLNLIPGTGGFIDPNLLQFAWWNPARRIDPTDKRFPPLEKSITKTGQIQAIIVNWEGIVIDGNRRLAVAIRLGRMVRYIVIDDLGDPFMIYKEVNHVIGSLDMGDYLNIYTKRPDIATKEQEHRIKRLARYFGSAEKVLEFVNHRGATSFDHGSFDKAENLVTFIETLTFGMAYHNQSRDNPIPIKESLLLFGIEDMAQWMLQHRLSNKMRYIRRVDMKHYDGLAEYILDCFLEDKILPNQEWLLKKSTTYFSKYVNNIREKINGKR